MNFRLYLELSCLKTTPFSHPASSEFVSIGTCFVVFFFLFCFLWLSDKDSKFVVGLGLCFLQAWCFAQVNLSFLLQPPEVKSPMELMAIPTCRMDPMLLHHPWPMGAIRTHRLLLVSLGIADEDNFS